MNEQQENHDWEAIATELAKGVKFAISYMKPVSPSGAVFNSKNNTVISVWEHLGKCLENYPGVTIDYEMLEFNSLPWTKRKKAVAELEAKRAAEAARGQQ